MKFYFTQIFFVFTLFLANATSANAGVVMTGTRVIYPAQNQEKTIQLQNKENKPYLVQVWLDAGDENSSPEDNHAPFIANPQIFKIKPNQGQIVRIIFTGEKSQLPQNKESLFFLNFTEIPAEKSQDNPQNKLMMVFKSRVKLFYRPNNLPDTPNDISKHLNILLKNENNQKIITIHNTSSYYANILAIRIKNGASIQQSFNNKTIAPHSSIELAVKATTSNTSQFQLDLINDYGATVSFDLPLIDQ